MNDSPAGVLVMKFDLDDLLAFRAVAELGSFARAADAVHVSPSAFSRRIDKLEQALGVRLLERTTRRVTLTVVGRDFARRAAQLLDDLDATLLSLEGVAAARRIEVTLSCVPSTVGLVGVVLKAFRERNPSVRVKLLDGGANEVLDAVVRGDADFGLNFIGSQEPDIAFEPLIEERYVVACRRDHPLARRRKVAWAELAGHDVVSVSRTSGNRLLLDQALAHVPERPRGVCEAEHVTAVLGLVEAGVGIAAVPSLAMPRGDGALLVGVPLVEPVVTRTVGLVRRHSRTLPPAAAMLHEAFLRRGTPARRPGLTRRKA
jgi:DNA-binding transcriptional LysR family regulator